jgi:hypothetical protein
MAASWPSNNPWDSRARRPSRDWRSHHGRCGASSDSLRRRPAGVLDCARPGYEHKQTVVWQQNDADHVMPGHPVASLLKRGDAGQAASAGSAPERLDTYLNKFVHHEALLDRVGCKTSVRPAAGDASAGSASRRPGGIQSGARAPECGNQLSAHLGSALSARSLTSSGRLRPERGGACRS